MIRYGLVKTDLHTVLEFVRGFHSISLTFGSPIPSNRLVISLSLHESSQLFKNCFQGRRDQSQSIVFTGITDVALPLYYANVKQHQQFVQSKLVAE